jgi:basic membrane protein A and related proteins
MERRTFLRGVLSLSGASLGVWLAGCGGNNEPSKDNGGKTAAPDNGKGSEGTNTGGKKIKAVAVLDTGGVDDKSFNAAAWAGLQRAEKELGAEVQYVESKDPSEYKDKISSFAAQGYDVVFAVGYLMEDALNEVAPQFPQVKFAIVDGNAPKTDNAVSLRFKEEQGSFLVGYLAGAMSKTHTIGFVGGQEIDLIKKFEAGYKAGAKTAYPQTVVKTAYTGDWNDLQKGKSQAEQLFGNGADIIFHGAGKAGLGVIRAAEAKGKGFYAIGVDSNQDGEAKGFVLTSMIKRVDNAVFDTIKKVKDGTFKAGEEVFDLKQDGVGISDLEYTKQDIPAPVLANLDKLKKMIADGTITVPATLAEADAFTPPKL